MVAKDLGGGALCVWEHFYSKISALKYFTSR